jgi:Ca-activated chloride channel family protein
VDVSASMAAQDVAPSRLEAAKRVAFELAENFPGSRLGLAAFAGECMPLCPMTLDHDALGMFIDMLDTSLVFKPGTSFAGLFKAALASFKASGASSRILVILSDGEDHDEESLRWAKEAAKEGIIIYTTGVGSDTGSTIPILSKERLVGFKKDAEGNTVVTKLNEPFLKEVAKTAGGRYFRLQGSQAIDAVVKEVSSLKTNDRAASRRTVPKDRFRVPLLVGLWLLVVEAGLGERKASRSSRRRAPMAQRAACLIFLLLLALSNAAGVDDADFNGTRKNNLGGKLYREQKYEDAVKMYLDAFEEAIRSRMASESDVARRAVPMIVGHNLGDALFKRQFYEDAIKIYQQALSLAGEDKPWQAKLNYNVGNVYYALSDFKRAIDNYRQALKLDPYDKDAKFNLELALKHWQERPKHDAPPNPPQKNSNTERGEDRKNPADTTPSRQPSPSAAPTASGGELSMEQALQLLDALKDQDRRLPMKPDIPVAPSGGKDW